MYLITLKIFKWCFSADIYMSPGGVGFGGAFPTP